MVAVKDCGAVAVFGPALTVTLPLPEPKAGATDSPALVPDAVHDDGAHPAGDDVTLTVWDPPPEPKFAVEGAIANVH
jgi:hypothetical protein